MFKEKFNTLAVAIEEFSIKEKIKPEFEKVSDQITYYKTIVDEYYYIKMNLDIVLNNIDSEAFPELIQEIHNAKDKLETYFNLYKDEFIVKSYIKEIETLNEKNTFFDKLFKFEKMLVETPIKKIENEILQDILVHVKKYASVTEKFYFFANNPFNIDSTLGIVIPKKFEYETADKLINGVYNYMYGLLNTYKDLNKTELQQLENTENTIREKLFQLNENLRSAKKKKIYVEFNTTTEEYVSQVNEIKNNIENTISEIVNLGIYRFYNLTKEFENIQQQYSKFINSYLNHKLYKEFELNKKFNNKLDNLQEIITLLEDGKINENKDYILTDINLKSLVEEIIELVRINKKKIFYTQKFHESGLPTVVEYEFYQTEEFLSDIKKYYFNLITNNIDNQSKLNIDELGDDTIDEYRINYKSTLLKYEQFLSQETNFMNEFEVQEYIEKFENIQKQLKIDAMNFFDNALKTSPLTFEETIENLYRNLLDKLKQDLEYVKTKNNLTMIKLNLNPNREIALTKLRDIEKHIEKLKHILNLSKKYVFIGMNDFIEREIYKPYNDFYNNIKESFNMEKYIKVITDYDNFYKESIFNFNMLISLEKLSELTEDIFNRIEEVNNIFIEEQISEEPILENNNISFINDLFDDETYKVVRNELFNQIDIFYEFVISKRENEKTFLINEKNLKKAYFDNQFIKLNYINIYHKVILERVKYIEIFEDIKKYDWFEIENKKISNLDYKSKLETLILNQNRILSEIKKMIVEYQIDTNFNSIDISSETIIDIENYIKIVKKDLEEYRKLIEKVHELNKHEILKKRYIEIKIKHTEDWKNIILNNEIPNPEKVSYKEMETFTGTIPFMVELEAKKETIITDEKEEVATFIWDFGNGIRKEGEKVSHVFYEEGLHTVKCEMTFESGNVSTRYLEFNLSGPTNSQIVKSSVFEYSPSKKLNNMTTLTYFDPNEQKQITIPFKIEGDVLESIKEGVINIDESDSELVISRAGLVILGFNGVEFAGEPFDNKQIFNEDFEMPEEAEFLFDFKVSDPIMNKSVMDISDSNFIESVSKIPKELYQSPYEINDASQFQEIDGTTVPLISGDMLILKNKMNRYAIVKINKIREITEPEENKKYFEMEFETFVNVSLNKYDRTTFKPLETNLVVPTLMFKTNVRELFSTLIEQLEKINKLRDELSLTNDNEKKITLLSEIEKLENENSKYYLFEEYNKLKAKIISIKKFNETLWEKCSIKDNCLPKEMSKINKNFDDQLNKTQSFEMYMQSINVYEFRKNIVDSTILIEFYEDQLLSMEILIDTYNFKKYNTYDYYINKVKKLKYFPNEFTQELENSKLPYEKRLVLLVEKIREFMFKIKLIINYPIMTEGNYISFSQIYTRPVKNEETGEFIEVEETDLYLLNKKLEMIYGFESEKIEMGALYSDFIGEIINKQKSLFGAGLSEKELNNLGNYIQVVETKTVEEYDDFFMIPFWIDYLNKLN